MKKQTIVIWLGFILISLACSLGTPEEAVISESRPVSFEVQTATPTTEIIVQTPTSTKSTDDDLVLSLDSAPTYTPNPDTTPTLIPVPTDTPVIIPTDTPTVEAIEVVTTTEVVPDTEVLTDTAESAPEAVNPPVVEFTGELDPPINGGEWDFEADFVLWENPYGDCSGALVGAGWTAFVEDGPYGSSCMGENLYPGDVQSGAKSQEITFDFIAANSGILRTFDTIPGHRYEISAYAKHVRSVAPVQMALGVDFTGGLEWTAETIQWFAWQDPAEDVWTTTTETVTATEEKTTLFIKGFHPSGDQGGKTYIDNVSITHLGP